MIKLRTFLLLLIGGLMFARVAESRVCFLAGDENEQYCLVAYPKAEKDWGGCDDLGYEICSYPQDGAATCRDFPDTKYKPEDCCSNTEYWEPCVGHGKVCDVKCTSGSYWTCENGNCHCDPSFSETCPYSQGLEGVGEPCDGKYQACKCRSEFKVCSSAATGKGSSCRDDRGTLWTQCECPSNWTTRAESCCNGYSDTCINDPAPSSSERVAYKCNPEKNFNCTCGYTYETTSGREHCVNGCTDGDYEYQGNVPSHATCSSTANSQCASGCTCNSGYFDNDSCSCAGYSSSSCSGNWVGCPCDPSKKKCL